MAEDMKSTINNHKSLRILIVEDSEDDLLLMIRELKKGGFNPVYERVETASEMRETLKEKQWDIILCDYKMPHFSAPSAIALLKETKIDIPILIISGKIGEETAAECILLGAQDYIMKDNMSRLCPAVARELEEADSRSKRKQMEQALFESEEKYRNILENIEDGYYEVDLAGNFTFFNSSLSRILGYPKEEMMGMNNRQYTDKEGAKKRFQVFNQVYKTGQPTKEFDWQIIRKDGTKRHIEASVSLLKDSSGKASGFRGIVRDITERKKTEEALQKSEAKYRQLIENAHEGIFQSTAEGRHITVNQAFADILGYDSPEEVLKNISDIAHQIYVNPEDRTKILQTIEKEGSVKGYEAEFYRKDGSKIWVSINMHAVRDNQGKILYYQGIDQDITDKKRIETERQENIERLRRSLGATINAMAVTVETRDPYTAGHQRRVADLARAIASEMNLSSDQVDGIRMASTIHDIGKISIPSEILSKPTKLTELEFNLIKTHSQSGYNILKDINFLWPVAEIILQHHERINGSGYPYGLKGDEILLGAQILAVADVVEAISSHRPYRPAFGINIALNEITKNRGILYNPKAADACLRLFNDKNYKFSI